MIEVFSSGDRLMPEGSDFSHPRVAASPNNPSRFSEILDEIQAPDDVSPLALESIGLALLVSERRRVPRERHAPVWLRMIRESICESRTPALNLTALALHAGVHPAHLAREFRRYFGMSIGQYVRTVRLGRARHLLDSTEIPIADVAASCGFADQSHFTREFRRAVGTTPARYRRTRERLCISSKRL
ncbi:MAG: helix-turn-helix transcriptional regulator [Acidobacteriota bacterium]